MTLAHLPSACLAIEHQRNVVVLSIDDTFLVQVERQSPSQSAHIAVNARVAGDALFWARDIGH